MHTGPTRNLTHLFRRASSLVKAMRLVVATCPKELSGTVTEELKKKGIPELVRVTSRFCRMKGERAHLAKWTNNLIKATDSVKGEDPSIAEIIEAIGELTLSSGTLDNIAITPGEKSPAKDTAGLFKEIAIRGGVRTATLWLSPTYSPYEFLLNEAQTVPLLTSYAEQFSWRIIRTGYSKCLSEDPETRKQFKELDKLYQKAELSTGKNRGGTLIVGSNHEDYKKELEHAVYAMELSDILTNNSCPPLNFEYFYPPQIYVHSPESEPSLHFESVPGLINESVVKFPHVLQAAYEFALTNYQLVVENTKFTRLRAPHEPP